MGNSSCSISNGKVNILLSTYNGEKYLEAQLDSLLSQTYHNFEIFIRDDGSTDKTVSIIKEFIAQHSHVPVHFLSSSGKNIGYKRSFWALLSECDEAEFYAFCDQDDIWLPDKIKDGVNALLHQDRTIPLIYTSGYDYYSEELEFQGHGQRCRTPVLFRDVLFYAPAFGFTILLNNCLRSIALTSSCLSEVPHDDWCMKIATSLGRVIYNPDCYAKYRRHAVTATKSEASHISMLLSWFKKEIIGNQFQSNYILVSKFLNEYSTLLDKKTLETAYLFSKRPVTVSIWLRRTFYPHRLRPTLAGELALRICFMLNR